MTFTNKAAKEISERIAKLAGQSTKGMFVGTIHRLAGHVLTQAPGTGGTRIDAIAKPGSQHYRALERLLDDVLKADGSLREALAVRLQAHVRIPPSDGKHDEMVRVSLMSGPSTSARMAKPRSAVYWTNGGSRSSTRRPTSKRPQPRRSGSRRPRRPERRTNACRAATGRTSRSLWHDGSVYGWNTGGRTNRGTHQRGGCRRTTQIRRRHAVETAHARSAENTTGGNALGPVRAGAPGQRRLGPHGGRGHRARDRLSPGITAGRGQRTQGRAQGLVRRADTGEIVFGRRVIPR